VKEERKEGAREREREKKKSSESAQKPEVRSMVPWGRQQQTHSPVIPNFSLNANKNIRIIFSRYCTCVMYARQLPVRI
jgi:hypothetical protein